MSLLAHYKLNGDATDASGNGLNGSANGGSYVTGKIGQAWDNAGNSRVLVPYSAPLYPGDYFTVAGWVNLATLTFGSNAYVFAQYNFSVNKRQWTVMVPSGSDNSWTIRVSSDGTNFSTTFTGIAPATGWHHVAVTCDNATKEWNLYIDGELASTVTATYSFANQGSNFTFGGLDEGYYPNAAFDDVRLYDEILPDWKIKAIANGGDGTEGSVFGPYRRDAAQTNYGGAVAGDMFLTGAPAGQDFHTGAGAGQIGKCS